MPDSPDRSEEAKAKEVRDLFEVQWEYGRDVTEEYQDLSRAYEQIIDPETWETESEITLGIAFSLVQNLIPAVMYYTLWAPDYPFDLIPREPKTTFETARKVRDNIIYTQRERMNLEWEGYYSILNALKYGVGYTLIEPKRVVKGAFGTRFAATGAISEESRTLEIGRPTEMTSCRNIGVGRVWPTPDGSEPEDVTAVSVLDFMDEFSFRKMLEDNDTPQEGDADAIIDYARKNRFNGWSATARQIAATISGHATSIPAAMGNGRGRNLPASIPILKQFRKDRHVWLACDKFIIYDLSDDYTTLHKPLCKATFSPDGDLWHTQGLVGRTMDAGGAIEAWTNAMTDMLSLSLHPHKIVNVDTMVEEDVQDDLTSYGVSRAHGDPKNAIHFAQYPQLPPEAFSVPENLRAFVNEVVGGAPTAGGSGTPGLVRGGTGALEGLLQVSTNREKATAKHVENGWYKSVCRHTLIMNQVLIGSDDGYTIERTADKAEGKRKAGERYFELASVTQNDVRQEWRMEFNFREKLRNFLAESSHRIQVYRELVKDEKVNPDEARAYLVGDEYLADRLTRGANPEERRAQLAAQSQQGGAQPLNPITAGRGVGLQQ